MWNIIGYKPNVVDTVRGCLMGTADSKFFLETYDSMDSAAKCYAEMEMELAPTGRDKHTYTSWDLYAMFNGAVILDNNGESGCHDGDEDLSSLTTQFNIMVDEYKHYILTDRAKKEEEEKEKQKKRREQERLKKAREKEEKDRAEYERLRVKYGAYDVV